MNSCMIQPLLFFTKIFTECFSDKLMFIDGEQVIMIDIVKMGFRLITLSLGKPEFGVHEFYQ